MADVRICPETGLPMIRGVRALMLTYKEQSVTIDMPGWYREGSDEGIHGGEDLKVSDRALATLKARVLSLLGPDEVRAVRERLGLTQREAGDLIGGGPNAFQKYESGEILVSKAVSNLLGLLDRHPEQLGELRREAQPA